MNVLQIVPQLNAGGVERTTLEVSEALIKAGHAAHIISAGGRMETDLAQMGAQLHTYDVGWKNPFLFWPIRNHLMRIMKAHNITLVHARSRAPAWPGFYAAKALGIPFVTTYHGIYNSHSSLKTYYNSIMTRGTAIIANSNFTQAHIVKTHKIDPKIITVIPRGVDMDIFDPSRFTQDNIETQRQAWNISKNEIVILLPGRLTRWKGQLDAIRAISYFAKAKQNVKLVIMGDPQGRAAYVQTMKDLISTLSLSDYVHIAPHSLSLIHI